MAGLPDRETKDDVIWFAVVGREKIFPERADDDYCVAHVTQSLHDKVTDCYFGQPLPL